MSTTTTIVPGRKIALISVYDKKGVEEFAVELIKLGWEIWSSGGTAKKIAEAGLQVKDVAELVGNAMLDHRVVTLAQPIHAGLLAMFTKAHEAELEALGLSYISLVCVDLYPLREEIAKPKATFESVIDKTDVGGPTMLHSGAKGQRIVICDPADRPKVIQWLKEGMPHKEMEIRKLAAKAEFTVSHYILASSKYLGGVTYDGIMGTLAAACCYGENRRQGGAGLYVTPEGLNDPLGLHKFELVEGNAPSVINYTDVHRVLETACRMGAGAEMNFYQKVPRMGVAVKHGNACGAALGINENMVTQKMVQGDPEAISGGVVLFNYKVTGEIAHTLRHEMSGDKPRIIDAVLAPDFDEDAVKELVRKTGRCRFFKNPALATHLSIEGLDTSTRFRQVRGGFLRQDGDPFVLQVSKIIGSEKLESEDVWNLVLAWALGSTSNSNTITLVKNAMLIGQGVGQRSRVMAAKLALFYATTYGHSPVGAMGYSDSFFPFIDGPVTLAEAGVDKIFATSGSQNDAAVIEEMRRRAVTFLMLPDAEARGFYGH